MDSTTPLSLLVRIRDDGDSSAWRQFDSIYRPMLTRYARLCGLAHQDTEDIVQGCLAAIHQKVGEFVHDGNGGRFRGWLRTLVVNRVRNALAKRREPPAGTGQFDRPQEREPPPEDAFDRIWWAEHLRFYLGEVKGEVDDRDFRAFERHVIQERPVEEVCRELGLTPGQLYKIKWRITQKLRDRMGRMVE